MIQSNCTTAHVMELTALRIEHVTTAMGLLNKRLIKPFVQSVRKSAHSWASMVLLCVFTQSQPACKPLSRCTYRVTPLPGRVDGRADGRFRCKVPWVGGYLSLYMVTRLPTLFFLLTWGEKGLRGLWWGADLFWVVVYSEVICSRCRVWDGVILGVVGAGERAL